MNTSNMIVSLGCIYLITNNNNGKKYVGQHNKPTPESRGHFNLARRGSRGCPVLYDAIRKHGEENFKIETLWVGPLSELDEKEEHYAEVHKTYVHNDPPGYNVAHCGNQPGLGRIVSEEERAAFSLRMREMPRTDEHCGRISVGVSKYIASHPEEMTEKAEKIRQTLLARGPTGPQSEDCIRTKIAVQEARTDNLPDSSGERQIWKSGNVWQLSIKNGINKYEARFSSKERAVIARDLFKSTGDKSPSDFPKKVSAYGPMIRMTRNGKYMVDIHSKRFPETYAKVFETHEEAIASRDEFLKRFV